MLEKMSMSLAGLDHNMDQPRHRWWANGVRLVLLALLTTACANVKKNNNANNASLTPPQSGPCCDQGPSARGRFIRRAFITKIDIFLLLMFFSFFQVNISCGSDAKQFLEDYKGNAKAYNNFVAPSSRELQQLESLFYKILTGQRGEDINRAFKELNFSIKELVFNNRVFTLIAEDVDHKTGRGIYMFPQIIQGQQVLMIPHGFHDLYTSDIGFQLTLEGHFAATLFNSVHRYGHRKKNIPETAREDASEDEMAKSPENWDMAARPDTCFTAFTRAFVAAFPKGALIQLHGFSQKKRKTHEGRTSDFILSSGTGQAGEMVTGLANCFKRKLPGTVRVYPADIKELGGTQNVIGASLRSSGHQGFIHMEMNRSTREKMKNDPGLRQLFLACIQGL